MYPILYKYLLVNKQMTLPGLGVFNIKPIAAELDFVKGVLHAPQVAVHFTKDPAAVDKNLFQYLSKELGVDEWQAVRKFIDFTYIIKETIETKSVVELPGLGKLQKSVNNEIYFVKGDNLKPFANDIKLNAANDSSANLVELYVTGDNLILTEETEDDKLEMIVKEEGEDYWWVYALILALMGVGALLYYYI